MDAVRAYIAAGFLQPRASELIAAAFWAASHGVVRLHLNGLFGAEEAKAISDRALSALADGFRPSPSSSAPR